ncbi:MAG: hypothetical protein AB7I38_15425 [Dehalococcoidia bacterium]
MQSHHEQCQPRHAELIAGPLHVVGLVSAVLGERMFPSCVRSIPREQDEWV